MSNCCPTSSTSAAGSSPAFVMAAKTSYSLPKPQLPIFLPLKSAAVVMFLSLKDTWSVPERWNTWATLVIIAPCSREARALGTQEIA